MKLHLITIGSPKLMYAKLGWEEYLTRLKRYHQVRVSHLSDTKDTYEDIKKQVGKSYSVALVIEGELFSSRELATLLAHRAQDSGRETSFLIGGPDGLPEKIIAEADTTMSFGKMTFPHDLAMVVLAESLYRASTINKNQPYHH